MSEALASSLTLAHCRLSRILKIRLIPDTCRVRASEEEFEVVQPSPAQPKKRETWDQVDEMGLSAVTFVGDYSNPFFSYKILACIS